MTDDDLERLIGRALRALPPPAAPGGLLPRVLAATLQSERRPWYTRGWFTWRREWQVTAVVTLLALVAGGVLMLPDVYGPAVETVERALRGPLHQLGVVSGYIGLAIEVLEALGQTLQPLVAGLVAVVLLMCLACAVFGSALGYVIPGRMAER